MNYVTYDEQGSLTGGYQQDLHPDHAERFLPVTAEQASNWVLHQINDAGDGVELRDATPPAPTEAQIVAGYMAAVQQHMDARAVAFGYDSLISVITYAEEPAVPRYQSEGREFRAWRSACWFACEQMLADVKAGARAAPTHAELIAELPALALTYSGPFAG